MSFNRPIALMCYICGREYGTKSLGIHLKTCQQKWEVEEAKKPKSQRRPMPLPPAGLEELLANPHITAADISDFNSGAFKKYNNEALVKCPNCNRTFKPEALEHHQKACSKENPFKPLPGSGGQSDGPSEYADNDANSLVPCTYCSRKFAPDRIAKHESVCPKFDKSKPSLNQSKPSAGGSVQKPSSDSKSTTSSSSTSSSFGSSMKPLIRPKTLMCFICGREYGTKSLLIHLKSCEEKWENEQSKLPKKDRRPMPQPPQGLFELLENEDIPMEEIEKYNKTAFNSYNFTALVPCKHCGRTFKQEAFDHHSKVCTAENPFKPINREGQDPSAQGEGDQDLVPCTKCARKFAADRIDKHEAVCKGTGGASTSTGTAPKTAPITIKKSNTPQQAPPSNEPKPILRPRTLVCYICGREFGTTSLSIHLKSCEQKWYNEQEKLPKKDRRPLPKQPAALTAMLSGQVSTNEMESYNSKAMDTFNTDSLLTCKFCQRTFTESALSHHSKVCTAEKPFKPVNKPAEKPDTSSSPADVVPSKGYNLNSIPEDDDGGDNNLVPCSKCGRNFNADRVAKHEKVCKGPSELKKKEIEPPKTDKPTKKKEGNWKAQHDEFIQSMQYMKKVKEVEQKGGDIRSIGPPPKANTDNLVPCPYCGRKFNEQVAERHIPSCKNVINKPKSVAQSAPKTFSQQNGVGSTSSAMRSPYQTTPVQVKSSGISQTSPTKPVQSKISSTSSTLNAPSQSKNIFKKP